MRLSEVGVAMSSCEWAHFSRRLGDTLDIPRRTCRLATYPEGEAYRMKVMSMDTAVGSLAVEATGQGPPIVFWHSLFVDRRSWNAQRDLLADTHRVVLIDGPGHGQSGHPDTRYTLEDCAGAALTVLDALEIPSTSFVGCAWGGHVGVTLAARHPKRVSRLVVLCSPMQPLVGLERGRAAALTAAFRFVGARPFLVEQAVRALVAPNAPREAKAYVEACLKGADRRGLVLAMRSVMLGRPSLVDLLPTIRNAGIPCLFATGDHDSLWPPALAAEHAKLAGADFRTFTGVAHLPSVEAPDEVNALLSEWLRQERGSARRDQSAG
jgi:pimeloyl-ACP methyl ester carboxylesterase